MNVGVLGQRIVGHGQEIRDIEVFETALEEIGAVVLLVEFLDETLDVSDVHWPTDDEQFVGAAIREDFDLRCGRIGVGGACACNHGGGWNAGTCGGIWHSSHGSSGALLHFLLLLENLVHDLGDEFHIGALQFDHLVRDLGRWHIDDLGDLADAANGGAVFGDDERGVVRDWRHCTIGVQFDHLLKGLRGVIGGDVLKRQHEMADFLALWQVTG